MLLGALAYLAWLRWWQQYPYAYLKGAAYAGFVFMGLAAAGWQALASGQGQLRERQIDTTAKSAEDATLAIQPSIRPARARRFNSPSGALTVIAPL